MAIENALRGRKEQKIVLEARLAEARATGSPTAGEIEHRLKILANEIAELEESLPESKRAGVFSRAKNTRR